MTNLFRNHRRPTITKRSFDRRTDSTAFAHDSHSILRRSQTRSTPLIMITSSRHSLHLNPISTIVSARSSSRPNRRYRGNGTVIMVSLHRSNRILINRPQVQHRRTMMSHLQQRTLIGHYRHIPILQAGQTSITRPTITRSSINLPIL